MQLVGLDGYEWSTYRSICEPPEHELEFFPENYKKLEIKTVPFEDGVNYDCLFLANLTRYSESRQLVSQFLQSVFLGNWIMSYGRVRFILMIHDDDKERILPHLIQTRGQCGRHQSCRLR